MGVGRIFSRGVPLAEFSNHKIFSRGDKPVEISFFLLEPRKRPFLLKMQYKNAKFQNPGGLGPLSDAHDQERGLG